MRIVGLARRSAAVIIGGASTAAGFGGAWYVTGSDALGSIPTPVLIGVIGLALLPAGTCLALLHHWRTSALHAEAGLAPRPAPPESAGPPRHGPHEARGAARSAGHRRRTARDGEPASAATAD